MPWYGGLLCALPALERCVLQCSRGQKSKYLSRIKLTNKAEETWHINRVEEEASANCSEPLLMTVTDSQWTHLS